jgi:predicted peptidase
VAGDYSVDPKRVILTGLSNGGHGVWAVAARYPDRFAGLVPMCGHSDLDDVDKLTKIPIWCFHNSVDPFVPSGGSKEMCQQINKLGGNAKYTQYGDFGHNCWDKAYSDGELWKWMAGQSR